MAEKSFQSYFVSQLPHGYRTSLTSGSGFPDTLLIHGERHSLVELKLLRLGKSGDKKLKQLFEDTQPPFYMEYLHKGGKRLFVVFKLDSGYGLLKVNKDFVLLLISNKVSYLDLSNRYLSNYTEFRFLKDLIKELEK